MNLLDLRKKYQSGVINKQNYISEMHSIHKLLFDYSSYLKYTDIEKIVIQDSNVIMRTRNNGIDLVCDRDDARIIPIEILNFFDYEKEEMDVIIKLISSNYHSNFTVFDIGANIGWYSINIAKKFRDISIHAFEPILKTYMYLTKNIENNSIANVVLNNFGFSNEEKEILFYYNKTGSGNSSMQNLTGSDSAEKIPCIVKKIDAYVDEEKISVDLIKCDVEGAELFVFQGGIETLKKFRPIVFTEMLRKWSALFNYHPNEIIELFVSIGYECFIINNGRLNKILEITEETEETNFIFLFPSKHMF